MTRDARATIPSTIFAVCMMASLALADAPAQPASGAPSTPQAAPTAPVRPARDGQRDFDFHLGTWKTHFSVRLRPLTGSTEWATYEGTTTVRPVWGGRGNLVELVADGPAGHFEGLSLRLYNPKSRQWSLNFANAASGVLATPTVGEFRDGRGEFYDQEPLDGRMILVRFLVTPVGRDTVRFEQAYSDDGGRTWEVNWLATDARVVQPRDPRSGRQGR